MSIRILAVGKKHESWVLAGIERFEKRLRKPWDVNFQFIAHSSLAETAAREDESKRILAKLMPGEFVVLLDERGENLSSPDLSKLIAAKLGFQPLTFIIGGAYGVNSALRNRADRVWSLSKLVFPHQLVRLILVEQIYRSSEIAAGRPYHHE